MKPVIGIVSRPFKDEKGKTVNGQFDSFRRAIIKNGGIPLGILPPQDVDYIDIINKDIGYVNDEELEILKEQINKCDGIIFQGGNRWYHYDEVIVKYCIDNDIPGLFICMSMQLLGKLDISNYSNDNYLKPVDNHNFDNESTHDIIINKDSMLYEIIGKDTIKVNSHHLYSIVNTYDLKIGAMSLDNVIEEIEYPGKKFIMGLQWHPEMMYNVDSDQNKIINYFINKCYKED